MILYPSSTPSRIMISFYYRVLFSADMDPSMTSLHHHIRQLIWVYKNDDDSVAILSLPESLIQFFAFSKRFYKYYNYNHCYAILNHSYTYHQSSALKSSRSALCPPFVRCGISDPIPSYFSFTFHFLPTLLLPRDTLTSS